MAGSRAPTNLELDGIRMAWELYFHEDDNGPFHVGHEFVMIALEFIRCFQTHEGKSLFDNVDLRAADVIKLNYDDFIKKCEVHDLEESLREESQIVLDCLCLSVSALQYILGYVDRPHRVAVRLQHVHPVLPLKEIKAQTIGSFIAIRGNVVRVSAVRPLVTSLEFICAKCRARIRCVLQDGKYEPPTRCSTGNCRSRRFEPDRASADTRDWQKLKIQEMEEDQTEPGRIPRTIEIELTNDLVDSCVPGDVVTVAGVIKSFNTEVAAGRSRARARSLFLLYMDAHSVSTHKVSHGGSLDSSQFSLRELHGVRAIAYHEDPFALVVASLCPSIFGHESVKAGLVLGLFGGTTNVDSQQQSQLRNDQAVDGTESGEARFAVSSLSPGLDRWKLGVRSDPHVLVVGDPGLGKSQMLRAASGLSPRGVYICGNTASTTGLTVTVVRDQLTGDYALEAGALVLSDQGVCCIDEFDKVADDHQALLEAMEQQRISVAKAGIVSSLSARATVLAAANPAGGHYDRSRTIAENLKMSPALLSRFDLVFIMLDKPDAERDKDLSAHVMEMHARGSLLAAGMDPSAISHLTTTQSGGAATWVSQQEAARVRQLCMAEAEERLASQTRHRTQQALDAAAGSAVSQRPARQAWEAEEPFDTRLRRAALRVKDPVPHALLRKYVAYARRYCHPLLSRAAAKVLQDFYLSLRQRHGSEDSMPITTRQLESLIRLSQARAKVELRETVTRQDALDVVELMRSSLLDAAMDDLGVLDFSRMSGMSTAKQVKLFVSALNRAATQKRSSTFSKDELTRLMSDMHLRVPSVSDFIETLNQMCYLLKSGPKLYRLATSNFDPAGRPTQRGGGLI